MFKPEGKLLLRVGISNIKNYLGNKITASARNISNKMLNSRPAMYLKDKVSDLTMKAWSFGVKHVEVPTFAMAGGGSIGHPLKVPVGVGINQTKLDNLRQMKIEQGIKAGRKLKIASPNYKPYTSDHKKVLQAFPDFDETKPFIKTIENPNGGPRKKHIVHAYDPGPPPMAFENVTTVRNMQYAGGEKTLTIDNKPVTIKYNENGFPIFDDHALEIKGRKTFKIATPEFVSMKHEKQIEAICDEFDINPKIVRGWTLHHCEGVGEVQFVPPEYNKQFGHTGGMDIWGVGHKKR